MKVAEENGINSSKDNFSDSFQSMQVDKAAPKSTGVLVFKTCRTCDFFCLQPDNVPLHSSVAH